MRIVATGVCHTDAYTLSGKDPEGVFPAILGHEGGGVVEAVGEGVTSVAVGDHVIPLYTPECGKCKFCLSGKTNLCQAIRTTGQRADARRHHPLLKTASRSSITWAPRPSLSTPLYRKSPAKISKEAPLEEVCLLGCGVTTGMGAVMNTAKVKEGDTVAIFGLGGIGLSAIIGAKWRRPVASSVLISTPASLTGAQTGRNRLVNPKDFAKPIQEVIVEMTDGGVDFSFECIGNVNVMRSALECCHKGWGESVIIGVAGAGEEISTRPFQLVTGRVWRGSAFGGVKGRTQLPGIVQDYLDGKFALNDFITHTMPLEEINEAFELMHEGKSIRSVVHFNK